MGGGPEFFFFELHGEIAHSPKKPRSLNFASTRRLPGWTGDESSGIESSRELKQTKSNLDQKNAGSGIPDGPVVDVKEWKPEKFDLLLRDIH